MLGRRCCINALRRQLVGPQGVNLGFVGKRGRAESRSSVADALPRRWLSTDTGKEFSDVNEGLTGFPIVRLRVSNIVRMMADGKPLTRLLFAHCDEVLPGVFGKVSILIRV
jgi:hypothetical protein